MNEITLILSAVAVVAGVGLFVGLFLGLAGKLLSVEKNELEIRIRACLPSNNCGGCGYASCDAYAKEAAQGRAPANACLVGGKPVAEAIAALLGTEAAESVRLVAHLRCSGDCTVAPKRADYTGARDCRMAVFSPSKNGKACVHGCLGYGTCASVCPQNAITVEKGIACIDKERCVGCGACARMCPNQLIEILPYDTAAAVNCSSPDKLKAVKEVCEAGCLGCGVCAKLCPSQAITMKNNLPVIDRTRCTGCGTCYAKCPTKAIRPL